MNNEKEPKKVNPEEAIPEVLENLRLIRSGVSSIRQWVTFFGILWIIAAVVVGLSLLLSAAAHGASGSIVSSFKSPGYEPYCGIDAYGGYLYHITNYVNPYMRHILTLTTTGSVLGAKVAPATGAQDIDMFPGGAWVCAQSPGMVYRLDAGFNVVSSFAAPESGGIGYDGTYVWLTTLPGLVKMTTTGSIIATIPVNGVNPYGGLDVAGSYLWFGSNAGALYPILKTTTTGSVVESLGSFGRPMGVSWDAGYIWHVNGDTGWVYKRTTDETAVEPASLGRVKAVYR